MNGSLASGRKVRLSLGVEHSNFLVQTDNPPASAAAAQTTSRPSIDRDRGNSSNPHLVQISRKAACRLHCEAIHLSHRERDSPGRILTQELPRNLGDLEADDAWVVSLEHDQPCHDLVANDYPRHPSTIVSFGYRRQGANHSGARRAALGRDTFGRPLIDPLPEAARQWAAEHYDTSACTAAHLHGFRLSHSPQELVGVGRRINSPGTLTSGLVDE